MTQSELEYTRAQYAETIAVIRSRVAMMHPSDMRRAARTIRYLARWIDGNRGAVW